MTVNASEHRGAGLGEGAWFNRGHSGLSSPTLWGGVGGARGQPARGFSRGRTRAASLDRRGTAMTDFTHQAANRDSAGASTLPQARAAG
jgi:hypothetical protein